MKGKAALPQRLYYKLDQAAVELGVSPDLLLHFAAIGKLQIFALMKGDYSVIPLIDEIISAKPPEIDSCTGEQLIEAIYPALRLNCQGTLFGLWQWNASAIEHFGETKTDSFCEAIELPSLGMGLRDIKVEIETALLASDIPYQCDAFIITPGTYDGLKLASEMLPQKERKLAGAVVAQIYSFKRFSMTVRKENLYLLQSEIAKLSEPEPLESSKASAKLNGLALINQRKAEAKEAARQIARALWQEDTIKQYRIGDMAAMVFRKLHADGMRDALPDTHEGVAVWIKAEAPEYAKKPGRPKTP